MGCLRSVKAPSSRWRHTGGLVSTAKRFPVNPPHPERNCWGCDRYCAANAMLCGNGSDRTQHPIETFGPGWETWSGIPVPVLTNVPEEDLLNAARTRTS